MFLPHPQPALCLHMDPDPDPAAVHYMVCNEGTTHSYIASAPDCIASLLDKHVQYICRIAQHYRSQNGLVGALISQSPIYPHERTVRIVMVTKQRSISQGVLQPGKGHRTSIVIMFLISSYSMNS